MDSGNISGALYCGGHPGSTNVCNPTEVSKPLKCWKHLYLELTGRRGGTGWDTPDPDYDGING